MLCQLELFFIIAKNVLQLLNLLLVSQIPFFDVGQRVGSNKQL
jgi:hypothetical protein